MYRSERGIPLYDNVLTFVVAELIQLAKKCFIATIDGKSFRGFVGMNNGNALDGGRAIDLRIAQRIKARSYGGRRARDELPPSHVSPSEGHASEG
jgi:hypothetical protein